MKIGRFFAASILLLSAALLSRAQYVAQEDPAKQAEPKPLEQRPSESPDAHRRIKLDMLVTDQAGKPVAGLEPSDFTILDNQKPQKLLSFQRAGRATPESEVIFVFDGANTPYQEMLYDRRDVEKYLLRSDGKLAQPTSIVLVSDTDLKMQPKPSRDGKAMVKALEGSQNPLHVLRRASGGAGQMERAQLCLRALSQLASYEYTRPGHKIVVWIGPGWSSLARGDADMSPQNRKQVFDTIVLLSTRLREARITLYSVDSGGQSGYYQVYLKPVTSANNAMSPNLLVQVLATQTGGRAIATGNNIYDGIMDVLGDLSAWYTLSFNSAPTTRTDEYHSLEVKLKAPHLTAHTSTGYYNQP